MTEPIYCLRRDCSSYVMRADDDMVIAVNGMRLWIPMKDIKLLIKRMEQCYSERF